MLDLNPEAEKQLQSYLTEDERLLWAARPKRGLIIRTVEILNIPFSIIWVCFAFFVINHALYHEPIYFILCPLLYASAFYIIFGRFIWDIQMRARTFYGLTKNRVIIKTGILDNEIKIIPLKSLPNIDLLEHRRGLGSIRLGNSDFSSVIFLRTHGLKRGPVTPKLEYIENAAEVYNTIRQLRYQ